MLWLAGLMGLMAVGAAAFVEPGGDVLEEQDTSEDGFDSFESDMTGFFNDVFGEEEDETPSGTITMTDPGLAEPFPVEPGSEDTGQSFGFESEEAEHLLDSDPDTGAAPNVQALDGEANGTLVGSDGADQLLGAGGDDFLGGYDGDDALYGGVGDDHLSGMDGADTLAGEHGADMLDGGGGDDLLDGGDGDDALLGHSGDDVAYGRDGDDDLHGGDGADTLYGGAGKDALSGGLGSDALDGGEGSDTLFGGWGNDALSGIESGPQAVDFLNGGGGDDAIVAGAGDIVTSGDGADQIATGHWVGGGAPVELIDFEPGEDDLLLVWNDTGGGAEPDVVLAPDLGDPGTTNVLMDGAVVAQMPADVAVSAEHITLMGQSQAEAAGLL